MDRKTQGSEQLTPSVALTDARREAQAPNRFELLGTYENECTSRGFESLPRNRSGDPVPSTAVGRE